MSDHKSADPQGSIEAAKAYFTEREVAHRLGISIKLLQKMRHAGGGIPFVKIGSAVRYSALRLREYEASIERSSTSDPGPNSLEN